MYEIGKDVLPHEYRGTEYSRCSAFWLRLISYIFAGILALCVLKTLKLGIEGYVAKPRTSSAEISQRADIVDRNGIVLAKSVSSGKVKLYPSKIKEKDKTAIAVLLQDTFGFSQKQAFDYINSKKAGLWIAENVDRDVLYSLEKKNRRYDCFEIIWYSLRKYPHNNIFAHVVGIAGKDEGQEGIEKYYDKYLKENTDPLKLSIDSRIQNIFYEQLTIAKNKYKAKAVMGMLMNARTGEMLSMVQLPDFDPNNIELYPVSNRTFRLLRDDFEMGSIFKIFNTALAYQYGLENREYKIDEPLHIYNKNGRDAIKPIADVSSFYRNTVKKKGIHKMSADKIMLYSCNTGSAQIALDLPQNAQAEFFHNLNLDKPLQLEFGKTQMPFIHKKWGPTEIATASFGHGISITPMHLLLSVNAMVNGGIYIYPTLLKRDIGSIQGERVISPELSEKLRNIMFHIVEETTGISAKVKGMEIGGKTGTAEKRDPITGKIDPHRNVTAFISVFPISAPQYIMLLLMDEPQPDRQYYPKTASYNVVPTAGNIHNGIMTLLFE